MRDLPPVEPAARGAVSLGALGEGIRFVFGTPLLRATMLLDGLATFFCSATALLPLFAQDVLQVGPRGYGWLYAAPSIGAVLTSAFMVRLAGSIRRRGVVLLSAVAVYGAATVVFGLSRTFWPMFLALAVTGAADTVSAVLRNIVRQLETPDRLRGRMVGISMLFFIGGPQLGEFESGVVAQWLGAGIAVVLGGIGSLVTTGADRLAVAGAPRVPPRELTDGARGGRFAYHRRPEHPFHDGRPDGGRPKEPTMTGKTTQTPTLETLDKERVLHPSTSIVDHLRTGPRIMAEGSGVMLTDASGRRYLDAFAGLWCVNIGYGRTEVADAMAAQSRRLGYYHTFSSMSNEPQIRLADRLLGMVPGRMSKVFFANSGSEANDTQVKLVWYYNNLRGKPQKKKIISRLGGYHGSTVAAASLTGLPMFHRAFDLPLAERAPHEGAGLLSRRRAGSHGGGVRGRRWWRSSRHSSSARARTRSPPSSPSRSWAPAACSSRRGRTSIGSRPCSGSTTSS